MRRVAAWENEKEAIRTTSDRLLRLIVARGWPVEDYSVDDLVKIDDPWSAAYYVDDRMDSP